MFKTVKATTDELMNIPRQLNLVLAAMFVCMLFMTASVLVLIGKS
jgi:hypothetical protein